MKKNKTTLISAILFLSYLIYITISYISFYLKKETYGNVYYDIYIYPHFILLLLGVILNFIYFFKPNKYIKIIMIISYIIGIIFLFI